MSDQLLTISGLSAGTEDKPILHNISLSVGAGETHVLMGPNGAGKSTLGHVIMGDPIYQVTSGSITFDGTDVTELNEELAAALRSHQYGGVLLYGSNVKGTEQTARLISALQQNNAQIADVAHVPYLLPVDEEGGIVTRLSMGTRMNGSMAVGATGDEALANAISQILASDSTDIIRQAVDGIFESSTPPFVRFIEILHQHRSAFCTCAGDFAHHLFQDVEVLSWKLCQAVGNDGAGYAVAAVLSCGREV